MTEPAKPFGFPMATTSWPTRRPLRVAEDGGLEVGGVRAQDGEVGERVGADDLGTHLAAVDEGRVHGPVGPGDDVRGGEHEPVRGDHDAAASPGRQATAADAPRHAQVRDRRGEELGNADDGAGVGVERFLVRTAVLCRRLLRPEERVDERKIGHRFHATEHVQVYRGAAWLRSRRHATARC